MKKLKISTRLYNLSDIEVSEKAAVITACMDGNTDFQNPYPTIPNIITLNADFVTAIVKAENGSPSDTAHKDELHAELVNALNALAGWVAFNCQDNVSILLSSGFHLREIAVKGRFPFRPDNIKLSPGNHSGEVLVSFKRPLYAISFIVRYSYDMSAGLWTSSEPFFKTKHMLVGLERAKEIWVQVKSVNVNGVSDWSNAVMVLVN